MTICDHCKNGNHDFPCSQPCECACHTGGTPSDEAIAEALIQRLQIQGLTREEVIGIVRDYFRK